MFHYTCIPNLWPRAIKLRFRAAFNILLIQCISAMQDLHQVGSNNYSKDANKVREGLKD